MLILALVGELSHSFRESLIFESQQKGILTTYPIIKIILNATYVNMSTLPKKNRRSKAEGLATLLNFEGLDKVNKIQA
jgi:hypothetical protein